MSVGHKMSHDITLQPPLPVVQFNGRHHHRGTPSGLSSQQACPELAALKVQTADWRDHPREWFVRRDCVHLPGYT